MQYVTSKGMLDLKSAATGDVMYGVASADVVPVRPATDAAPTAAPAAMSVMTEGVAIAKASCGADTDGRGQGARYDVCAPGARGGIVVCV